MPPFLSVLITRNISQLQQSTDGRIIDGVINQDSEAEIRWLIVPTSQAAGNIPNGRLFFVGATLSYRFVVRKKA